MEAILAFAAALVAFRLAGGLASRYWMSRNRALLVWSGALLSYALASAALAWGAAAGWDDRTFRVYYLFGGLLTAVLLGAGALLLKDRRWVAAATLVYIGLAIGIAVSVPLTAPVTGSSIPEAQAHLEFVPARLVAIVGNITGTVLVVGVAIATFRRRPIGNMLIVAGVIMAAAGSAVAGLGEAESAVFIMIAAVLLYFGFLASTEAVGRGLSAGRAWRGRFLPGAQANPVSEQPEGSSTPDLSPRARS